MESKNCSKCFKLLSLTQFYKDSSQSNGYCNQCKTCKNTATKERSLKNKNSNNEIPTEKLCFSCKEIKLNTEFYKTSTNKSGLSIYCKKCRILNDHKRIANKKEINIIVDDTINKKCTVCNLEKSLKEYKTNLKSNDNFSNICLDCSPKSEWTVEKQRISEKKYRLNNPEKMKEKSKKNHVRKNISSRIRTALIRQNTRKTSSTIKYIGCKISFFKNWIQYQFQENMSCDNYGQWHLDHVKPCASFDLKNENHVLECFNWKNYQPLWEKDNLLKSDKIDEKIINEHIKKVIKYLSTLNSAQVKEGDLLE